MDVCSLFRAVGRSCTCMVSVAAAVAEALSASSRTEPPLAAAVFCAKVPLLMMSQGSPFSDVAKPSARAR